MMSNDLFLHKSIGPENIGDVLGKAEQIFNVRFEVTELRGVKTFGQLSDLIYGKISRQYESCTSQQAFYKLRSAIVDSTGIPRSEISLQTCLKDIVSAEEAESIINSVKHQLGIRCHAGSAKTLSHIVQIVKGSRPETSDIDILAAKTLGRLAEKIAREHHIKCRKNGAALDRQRITRKLQQSL